MHPLSKHLGGRSSLLSNSQEIRRPLCSLGEVRLSIDANPIRFGGYKWGMATWPRGASQGSRGSIYGTELCANG